MPPPNMYLPPNWGKYFGTAPTAAVEPTGKPPDMTNMRRHEIPVRSMRDFLKGCLPKDVVPNTRQWCVLHANAIVLCNDMLELRNSIQPVPWTWENLELHKFLFDAIKHDYGRARDRLGVSDPSLLHRVEYHIKPYDHVSIDIRRADNTADAVCTCENLMTAGCTCGAMQAEREAKAGAS